MLFNRYGHNSAGNIHFRTAVARATSVASVWSVRAELSYNGFLPGCQDVYRMKLTITEPGHALSRLVGLDGGGTEAPEKSPDFDTSISVRCITKVLPPCRLSYETRIRFLNVLIGRASKAGSRGAKIVNHPLHPGTMRWRGFCAAKIPVRAADLGVGGAQGHRRGKSRQAG
jgi:hypothetical protein